MAKAWTVLVYMAGDNNLDKYAMRDLRELAQVGSGEDLNIVAQVDRKRQYLAEAGRWSETRRFYVERARDGEPGWREVGPSIGEVNTGDPEALKDFIIWGLTEYPAQRSMLVLWNHGGGWKEDDIYRDSPAVTRSLFDHRLVRKRLQSRGGDLLKQMGLPFDQVDRYILTDDTSADFLDNLELEYALNLNKPPEDPVLRSRSLALLNEGFRHFDILGFDACMMNMLEVIYQVRDTAMIAVGSEEIEPPDGWPYTEILRELAARPDMDSRDLAAAVVSHYLESYRDHNKHVTQSALDLQAAEPAARALDTLARALLDAVPALLPTLRTLMPEVQRFKDTDYVDLYDFAHLLTMNLDDRGITAAARGVKEAIDHMVIHQGSVGDKVRHANGVSAFFPRAALAEEHRDSYRNLLFTARYPHWLDFLDAYSSRSVVRR